MKHLLTACAFALSFTVAGCAGFQPMHGTASSKAAFADMSVLVSDGDSELDRAAGFLIRQRLSDRITEAASPTYMLLIEPSSQRIGLGLTGQNFATRFDGVLTARWVLQTIKDGETVANGTTISTATYSADGDAYRLLSTADEAAERAARELADRLLLEVSFELADFADKK